MVSLRYCLKQIANDLIQYTRIIELIDF